MAASVRADLLSSRLPAAGAEQQRAVSGRTSARGHLGDWLLGVLFTFATVGVLTAGCGVCAVGAKDCWREWCCWEWFPSYSAELGSMPTCRCAFYILAAVLLLLLYDAAERPQAALLLLSGLMAGLAASTKERRVVAADRPAGGASRRLLAAVPATGISGTPLLDRRRITALAMVAVQKLCLTGDNDLVGNQI